MSATQNLIYTPVFFESLYWGIVVMIYTAFAIKFGGLSEPKSNLPYTIFDQASECEQQENKYISHPTNIGNRLCTLLRKPFIAVVLYGILGGLAFIKFVLSL